MQQNHCGRPLVGHLMCKSPFLQLRSPQTLHRPAGAGARTALRVASRSVARPARGPLAAPLKCSRVAVPRASHRFQPGNYLVGRAWVLSRERPPLQDPLDRLSHVQPRAAEWRVEWHDPLRNQPVHQLWRFMAGQVVPYQQHPQRRQLVGQRSGIVQTRLPALPQPARNQWIVRPTRQRLGRHNRAQFGPQPGVQDLIGAFPDTFDAHLTARRVEQC